MTSYLLTVQLIKVSNKLLALFTMFTCRETDIYGYIGKHLRKVISLKLSVQSDKIPAHDHCRKKFTLLQGAEK